ncbi:MAG: major capsid protein [Desulfobacterales bacterium]
MPTGLNDVIVPEVLGEMVAAEIPQRAKILRSGIASFDYGNVDIKEGGNFFSVPYWDELTGEDEVIDGVNQISVGKITTSKDLGVVLHRGKAWGVDDLAKFVGKGDPNKEIGRQVGIYWAKRFDSLFIQNLVAIVNRSAGALKDSHVLDVAVTTGTKVELTVNSVVDALLKLGDSLESLTGIAMHSVTFGTLYKAKLIDYVQTSNADVDLGHVRIPTFLGREVIIDDTLPVDNSVADYPIYTTFLFGRGAGYVGYQRALMTEKDRDILAFNDILSTSVHFGVHLKLVKWNTTTVNPANTDLQNPANWLKVAKDDKMIKFVAVHHN